MRDFIYELTVKIGENGVEIMVIVFILAIIGLIITHCSNEK